MVVLLSLLSLNGCALFKAMEHTTPGSDPESRRIQAEREAERQAAMRQVAAFKKRLKPGLPMAEFAPIYGEPTRIEITEEGYAVHEYEDDGFPMFAVFKNDKLHKLIYDRGSVERRKDRAIAKQSAEAASTAAWGQVLQGLKTEPAHVHNTQVNVNTNRRSNGIWPSGADVYAPLNR